MDRERAAVTPLGRWRQCSVALALGFAAIALPTGGSLLAQHPARDVGHLGLIPAGRMHALLERTFLRVDVLTLDLCFDGAAAEAMASVRAGPDDAGRQARNEAVVSAALAASEAIGVVEFQREIDLDQFLDGIAEDQDRAVGAGFLDDSTRIALAPTLRTWYGFLAERGIRDGDRIYYRFGPESVRATYLGVEGTVHLDERSTGAQRRASILGAWFAPGSSLREELIESLFQEGGAPEATLDRCHTAEALPPPAGGPA